MSLPDILVFNHKSRILIGAEESADGTLECEVKLGLHEDGKHYGYEANG